MRRENSRTFTIKNVANGRLAQVRVFYVVDDLDGGTANHQRSFIERFDLLLVRLRDAASDSEKFFLRLVVDLVKLSDVVLCMVPWIIF